MQLKPGFEAEYRRRHDALWPDLAELLRTKGITDYSIFLDQPTGALIGVLRVADVGRMDELPQHPIMKKWWAYMKDIMDANPDDSPVSIPLTEVFHLD